MTKPNIEAVKHYLMNLQDQISVTLADLDGGENFREETWQYPQGGGGRTRVLENSHVIERGGVNFSHIIGTQLPPAAMAQRCEVAGRHYQATGISMVIHPRNPYAPTMHANLRFFLVEKEDGEALWWFGGGFDLTPYYGFVEDCKHWHRTAKQACEPFGPEVYSKFKKWCDEYFYIKHRQEARGIGGLFFDDVNEWGFERSFAFMQSIGDHIMPAYLPILKRRKDMPYGEREREFQLYRRGRYVEFNLVYDRGTLFGLQSGGRIESILVSMPPATGWRYNWQPEPGSAEDALYQDFLPVREWI